MKINLLLRIFPFLGFLNVFTITGNKPITNISDFVVDDPTANKEYKYNYSDDFDQIDVPVLKEDTDALLSYKYSLSNKNATVSRVYVYITNEKYIDTLVYARSLSTSLDEREFTLLGFYIGEINTLRFDLYEAANVLKSVEINCLAPTKEVVYPSEQNGKKTIPILMTYHTGSFDYLYESISFNNFDSLYITDYYHKIDISNYQIIYTCAKEITLNLNAYLLLSDPFGFFKTIGEENDSGYQLIKLKIDNIGNNYSAKIRDHLFVNPLTLEMSNIKYEKYVQTRYIFLPKNAMKQQSEFEIYFVIENFGINELKVFHKINVNALLNIFGDCFNSEYCIGSDYSSPISDIGKEIV